MNGTYSDKTNASNVNMLKIYKYLIYGRAIHRKLCLTLDMEPVISLATCQLALGVLGDNRVKSCKHLLCVRNSVGRCTPRH